jgi:hypothetical protein
MTRAPDAQSPDRLIRAEYVCHTCGAPVGHAELKIYSGYDEAALVVNGIVAQTTTWVETDSLPHVINLIERGIAHELFEWEHDSASFYCPTCDATYCQTHWQIETVFEDDPDMPGWYDCTYGTCPQGHRRMIDD